VAAEEPRSHPVGFLSVGSLGGARVRGENSERCSFAGVHYRRM
jgi:hypothetical protein